MKSFAELETFEKIITIIGIPFLICAILFIICSVIYIESEGKYFKKFYHDILDWHIPDDTCEFYGPLTFSKCKICGAKIQQDSQGNWY